MGLKPDADLVSRIEASLGCKQGEVFEGYGAVCNSMAHAQTLYGPDGCEFVTRLVADVLAPYIAEQRRDAAEDAWADGYSEGRDPNSVVFNPYRAAQHRSKP